MIGGKTPTLNATEFAQMGFGMVLYANAALQGALRGMMNALERLQHTGILDENVSLVATFEERQALVRKNLFDDLIRRYSGEDLEAPPSWKA